MENKWYKRSYFRNLVDMHIPDTDEKLLSKFDPEEYARLVALSGVDHAIIYTSNCLGITFFDTDNAHGNMNGRDFVGERIDALRRHGVGVIVYYNIWNRTSALAHPDWAQKRISRHPGSMNDRFKRCCLNSEGFRALVAKQTRELAERYDFDGVWIDMIDWFDCICGCDSCKKKFKAETGLDFPEYIDWNDGTWWQLRRARERWLGEFLDIVRTSITSVKPEATVTFQNAAWKRGFESGVTQESMDRSEFLAGDFYASPIAYSVTCKFLNNATRSRPIEFMTSLCADLSEHTTSKTEHELTLSVHGAIAHNTAFTFIDAIDPLGTMNAKRYERMKEIGEKTRTLRENISPDARLVSDVTLYLNHDSLLEDMGRIRIEDYKLKYYLGARLTSFATAMIEGHVAYDINLKKNLGGIRSQTVYIPDMRVISREEVDALTAFVKAGGRLVVSNLTGTIDPDRGYRDDFALAELLGVHYESVTDKDIVYFNATDAGTPYFDGYDEGYPVAVNAHGVLVRADRDTEILATMALPVSNSDDADHFSSAISNPPYDYTDYPAITRHRVGLGEAIYIAAPLEDGKQDMQKRLIRGLVAPTERLVTANAPKWLEVLLYDDAENERYILNCFNTMEHYYEATAQGVEVTARIDREIREVYSVSDGTPLPFTQEGDHITVRVGDVDGFKMVILK